MSSERARRFAAGLVATEKRIGWGVSVLGFWIQGVWARRARDKDEPLKSPPDTAEDFAETVRDAIATALDRYEAEAWTAITDDPGSWPPFGPQVLLYNGAHTYGSVLCKHDMPGAIGQWWRPLPAPPRGGV